MMTSEIPMRFLPSEGVSTFVLIQEFTRISGEPSQHNDAHGQKFPFHGARRNFFADETLITYQRPNFMKTPANYIKRKSSFATTEQVVDDVISAELRSYYSMIESQKIPPQFMDLLEKLDQKTKTLRS